MRRAISLSCLGLIMVLLSGAGPPYAPRPTLLSARERADLDRISAYLNSIGTLKSGFAQIDPNGALQQGTFYLDKPGRLRFEYDPPSPVLVVASGGTLSVKNSRLNTLDRYSVSDTPLDIILGSHVDLKYNKAILGVDDENGMIVVHARSSNNRVQGDITFIFASPNIELRQWLVKDGQGLTTTVMLRDVQTGMVLPDSLFTAPTKNPAPAKKSG